MKEKILYAITTMDVINTAEENGIRFTEKDVPFVQEKIGDYFGSKWQEAVDFALWELKDCRKSKKQKKFYGTDK